MEKVLVHRLYVRVFHWLNAIAIFMMIASGWRIYNASPLFDFRFPDQFTLGDWLGGALQWHFAAMWLFVTNLAVYIVLGLVTGHFKRKFFPLTPRGVLHDVNDALHFKLAHDSHDYNSVQKMFYIGIILVMLLTFVSGLAVWKSVQFQLLGHLFGGYEGARLVHFAGMSLICAFIVVHLALVLIVPSTLIPMITGRGKAFPKDKAETTHA
jgi:thiosulfate reductase cytochrome b subunit